MNHPDNTNTPRVPTHDEVQAIVDQAHRLRAAALRGFAVAAVHAVRRLFTRHHAGGHRHGNGLPSAGVAP